jgi:hypothetical protein
LRWKGETRISEGDAAREGLEKMEEWIHSPSNVKLFNFLFSINEYVINFNNKNWYRKNTKSKVFFFLRYKIKFFYIKNNNFNYDQYKNSVW